MKLLYRLAARLYVILSKLKSNVSLSLLNITYILFVIPNCVDICYVLNNDVM